MRAFANVGTHPLFIAKAKEDLNVIIPKGNKAELTKKIVIESLKDEYKQNEIVGKCEVYLDKEKVGEVEVYSDRDIEKGGIIENIKHKIKNLFD